MKIRGIKLHDMHLHIPKGCTVAEYQAKARSIGIEVMGITPHLWDMQSVPVEETPELAAGIRYYQDYSLERILEQRQQAQSAPVLEDGPELFWGCETEFSGPLGKVGVLPERARVLDYVVTPHSHLHLPGFTYPAELTEPKELAGYMVDTFCQVALSSVTDIIAHPFDPTAAVFQQPEFLRQIFEALPEAQLEYCFELAAKQGKVIEINLGSFVHGLRHEVYQKTFFPMFATAKKAGCQFCMASDAQRPEHLERMLPENFAFVVDTLELTPEDFALPGQG